MTIKTLIFISDLLHEEVEKLDQEYTLARRAYARASEKDENFEEIRTHYDMVNKALSRAVECQKEFLEKEWS